MNGTHQACAACKYQRRKCGPNCIFAPYFPHNRPREFVNAHKLFGVGKINNMMKPLNPLQRDIAMNTIIFQSNMRAIDPVGGCYGIIRNLESQIHRYKAELQLVLQQLAFYRAQAQQQHAHEQHVVQYTSSVDDIINAMDPLTLDNNVDASMLLQQETSHVDVRVLQEEDVMNAWTMQNSTMPLFSPLSLQANNGIDDKEDDYNQKPIFDLIKELGSSDQKH